MVKENFIYVGIDLHKETHTAVMIDCYNQKLGEITFPNRPADFPKLVTKVKKCNTEGKEVQTMFDYFNKPALDDAINAGKEIRFSHNPEAYGECALKWEWDYLQEKHGYFALEKKEIFGMQQNNFNDIRIDTGKKNIW